MSSVTDLIFCDTSHVYRPVRPCKKRTPMNKACACVFLCSALCIAALSAAPPRPAPVKPPSGAFDVGCLSLRAGAGRPVPLAAAAGVLDLGPVLASLIGWQAPLGPGGLKVG